MDEQKTLEERKAILAKHVAGAVPFGARIESQSDTSLTGMSWNRRQGGSDESAKYLPLIVVGALVLLVVIIAVA